MTDLSLEKRIKENLPDIIKTVKKVDLNFRASLHAMETLRNVLSLPRIIPAARQENLLVSISHIISSNTGYVSTDKHVLKGFEQNAYILLRYNEWIINSIKKYIKQEIMWEGREEELKETFERLSILHFSLTSRLGIFFVPLAGNEDAYSLIVTMRNNIDIELAN